MEELDHMQEKVSNVSRQERNSTKDPKRSVKIKTL